MTHDHPTFSARQSDIPVNKASNLRFIVVVSVLLLLFVGGWVSAWLTHSFSLGAFYGIFLFLVMLLVVFLLTAVLYRQFADKVAEVSRLNSKHAVLLKQLVVEKDRADKLLNVVIPIGVALSAEQNFDRLLEKILLEAKTFCHADAGTLYLVEDNRQLAFVLVHNDTLGLATGGSTGASIDFEPVALYDEDGQPNHSNVAAHVALTGQTVNIADAYKAEGFNFSGTQAFDLQTGYRSTSFLTVPLKNAHGHVLGVLQLINASGDQYQVIAFDVELEQLVTSLSSLASVALEAYIREQALRDQIQLLRIEVDEAKRKQQVDEIVETEFFKELQAKAREIRKRNPDDEV
jgi:GAF domain-containing protein